MWVLHLHLSEMRHRPRREAEVVRHIAVGTRMGGGVFALVVAMNAVAAQEVIELTGADRPLKSDYEEVYRIGPIDGDLWETFGEIRGTGFDAVGNLYIFDAATPGRCSVPDR